MKIEQDTKLDFDDLLLKPSRSTLDSRADVKLEREFKFYHSNKTWSGIPIISANMTSTGTRPIALALAKHKFITCLHKYYSLDELVSFYNEHKPNLDYVWFTAGKKQEEVDKLIQLEQTIGQSINILIDSANAHIESFVKFCANVRKSFPQSIIMAGNTADESSCKELILHGGVDVAKIGIGNGSHCTTRYITGVGLSQAENIIVSSSVHGLTNGDKRLGLICSDGGVKTPGCICKAFCLNADFVMTGKMFYAVPENSEGEWIEHANGQKKAMITYGMSSYKAQEKWNMGKKDYRASEGEVKETPVNRPIDEIVQEILGGIRSCCTLIGSDSLKHMSKCAVFTKVNRLR